MSSPPIPRPTASITTPRLLLRPLSPTDSDAVFAIRSHPLVLYWTTPSTRQQSDAWLQHSLSNPKNLTYTVSLLPSPPTDPSPPQVIGITGAHHLPEIGYLFHPDFWGKGYATEALRGWVEMYWREYGAEGGGHPALEKEEERGYLKAVTGPGGEGSRGVLRKCGFVFWGEEEVGDERKGEKEKGMKVVLQEFRLARPRGDG